MPHKRKKRGKEKQKKQGGEKAKGKRQKAFCVLRMPEL